MRKKHITKPSTASQIRATLKITKADLSAALKAIASCRY